MNRKRIDNHENKRDAKGNMHEYKIGDKVFIKNYSPNKIDAKWKGPYTVYGRSDSGNNVRIEMGNKIIRVSYKNCRPMWRGENVVPHRLTTNMSGNMTRNVESCQMSKRV
ncbi:Retrovirus-related Pol polyprotein [Dictyocoela roeselum]|nr:Retrovirus-related Pol polyprotein [Dictyocoela roeselum]